MVRPLTTGEIRHRKPGRMAFRSLPNLPLFIVCDNFHYAWNVGALFRIADALRIEKVYLCGISAYPPNQEVERTGGSAHKWVDWERVDSTLDAVIRLKEQGVEVVAAELAEGSIPLNCHEWRAPSAIVLGSEITGVQQDVIKQVDAVIELPMFGMKNSLNVASTAAVFSYDFLFRCLGGRIPGEQHK